GLSAAPPLPLKPAARAVLRHHAGATAAPTQPRIGPPYDHQSWGRMDTSNRTSTALWPDPVAVTPMTTLLIPGTPEVGLVTSPFQRDGPVMVAVEIGRAHV